MRANAIQWPKIRLQWEILKMSSAYIHAEAKIINDAQNGIDTTGHIADMKQTISFESPSVTPEEFYQASSPKESLLSKAREVRRQLDEAIDNDEYEKADMLQSVLDAIQAKYDKL